MAAMIALAALAVGCGKSRELHPGSLADSPDLTVALGEFEGTFRVYLTNRDARGGCLIYGADLEVIVDGARQTPEFLGGKSTSRTDWDEYCDSARFSVVVPPDPSRTRDVIEVRDGSRTARMETPSVLTPTSVRILTPAANLRAGKRISFELRPPPPAGVRLLFSIDPGPSDGMPVRADGEGFSSVLPAQVKPGAATVRIIGVGAVAPLSCTAATCLADAYIVSEAAITVKP